MVGTGRYARSPVRASKGLITPQCRVESWQLSSRRQLNKLWPKSVTLGSSTPWGEGKAQEIITGWDQKIFGIAIGFDVVEDGLG